MVILVFVLTTSHFNSNEPSRFLCILTDGWESCETVIMSVHSRMQGKGTPGYTVVNATITNFRIYCLGREQRIFY